MSAVRTADHVDVASVSYLETLDNTLSQEFGGVYDALASRQR